jgi:hypothetical protein
MTHRRIRQCLPRVAIEFDATVPSSKPTSATLLWMLQLTVSGGSDTLRHSAAHELFGVANGIEDGNGAASRAWDSCWVVSQPD